MLRRAHASDQGIVDRLGAASAAFCAVAPTTPERVVYCYETDGPQICAVTIVERADLRDDQDVVLYAGPAVEVSLLQPYKKPQGYADERPWIDIMFELLAFTFDCLVREHPEAADLRPYARLPDSTAAQAWRSRVVNFGNVQMKPLSDGRVLVYWAGGGTVSKLVNVRG